MNDWMRRIGRFTIEGRTIAQEPAVALSMLANMLVVRAEGMFRHGGVEYTAYSFHFDEVEAGVEPPVYIAKLERARDGSTAQYYTSRSSLGGRALG